MTPAMGPWEACLGTYLSRLHVDDQAYVSYDPPLANRVRSQPGTDGRIIGTIQPGEEVQILEGPACENNWVWWKVRSEKTGLTGWTAEGDREDYWLVPLPQAQDGGSLGDYAVVQIGYDETIYLRYEPGQWQSFNPYDDQIQLNIDKLAVNALEHWEIPGCILRGNLGFGPSDAWQRQDSTLTIGKLEVQVETWIEVATTKPVWVIYQYPAGQLGEAKRIELKIEGLPELCIEEAIQVLAFSEDLILGNGP
jgi:hypothetical protein